MKRAKLILIGFTVMMMFAVNAKAGDDPVNTIAEGCETELRAYCGNVMVGEGRVLACLYAHGDKLSGRCEYALYDAAAQLERFIATLSYLASECEDDLDKYCGSVPAGEGRLAKCLLDQGEDNISKRCNQAMKDTGLE